MTAGIPAAAAIRAAATEIAEGVHDSQFVVDVFQTGSGTSTNMNANEVIANMALRELGEPRGRYEVVNPNDHVNLSQSTNDVYPTAVRLTMLREVPMLVKSQELLVAAFEAKDREFHDIIKVGRTQLMDAVPMRLGSEFKAFAVTVGEDIERLREFSSLLREVNLGGTAVGTGLNAPAGYAQAVAKELADLTGLNLVTAPNKFEALASCDALVQAHGALKGLAVSLMKIANDVRWLASGPRSGLGEITIPENEPGSSIMPGKVNPNSGPMM